MTQNPSSRSAGPDVDRSSARAHPWRWAFVVGEAFVAVGAAVGAWQLWTGTLVPPVSDLEPLGLDSWRLPAVWLFASVAVPSTVAAVASLRRMRWAPDAVLVAAVLLLIEVTVQIPFVGPSVLQAVMGTIALVLGTLAVLARRSGGWRPRGTEECPQCHAATARALATCDACGYDLVRGTKSAGTLRAPA